MLVPTERSQGILMWNMKALALTVQKLLARLKFSKNGSNSKGQGHRVENNSTNGKVLSQEILLWNIKALSSQFKSYFQNMSIAPRSRSQVQK